MSIYNNQGVGEIFIDEIKLSGESESERIFILFSSKNSPPEYVNAPATLCDDHVPRVQLFS